MADKKFTLLELHLDGDTQFGPKVIGGEEEAARAPESRGTATGDDVERGAPGIPAPLKALGVLAVLAVVVTVVRKVVGGAPDLPESIEVETEEVESSAD